MVFGGGSLKLNPAGALFLLIALLLVVYIKFGSYLNDSHSGDDLVSLKSLLVASVAAAKKGGEIVKVIRDQADIGEKSKGQTLEGANNPVTDGDIRSHQAMYHGLKKTFPGLNVISEENDQTSIDHSQIDFVPIRDDALDEVIEDVVDEFVPLRDVDVWIDPLDATQEYTENLVEFVTTMVCVAVNGEPVIGVIHKPFSDETVWAWRGPDVYSNNVETIEKGYENKFRVIVSRSHAGHVGDVTKQVFGQEVEVTPAGGAGYKVIEVAKNRQDAYIHVTLIKKWDLCAGNAILNSLGGNMTDLNGHTIDYRGRQNFDSKNEAGVLASLRRHSEILEKLKNVEL